MTTYGHLYIRRPKGQVDAFLLTGQSAIIGRSTDADILIDHSSIAEQHARLHFQGAYVGIEDLETEKGTTVDGNALQPGRIYVLAVDSDLRLGAVVARWVPTGAPLPDWAEAALAEAASAATQPLATRPDGADDAAPAEPQADTPAEAATESMSAEDAPETVSAEVATEEDAPEAVSPEAVSPETVSAEDAPETVSVEDAPDTPPALEEDEQPQDILKLALEPNESERDFFVVLTSMSSQPVDVVLATGSRYIDLVYNLKTDELTLEPDETVRIPLKVRCTAEDLHQRTFKVQAQVDRNVVAQATSVLIAPLPEPSRAAVWIGLGIIGVFIIAGVVGLILFNNSVFSTIIPTPTEETPVVIEIPPTRTPEPTFTPLPPTAVPPSGTPSPTAVPPTAGPPTPVPIATIAFPDGVLTFKTGSPGQLSLLAQVPGSEPVVIVEDKAEITILDFTRHNDGLFAIRVVEQGSTAETLWLVRPDGSRLQTGLTQGWDRLVAADWAPDGSYLVVETETGLSTQYYIYRPLEVDLLTQLTLIPATITLTPTFTRTPSPTLTLTPSRTPTFTLTPSRTPTNTPTPSSSPTPTNTSTPTSSSTPTATVDSSATVTSAATATQPQQITVTPAPTITPSVTATLSPTPPQAPESTATQS